MVRQIRIRHVVAALMLVALTLALAGCGVKGPLRPASKATPATQGPAPIAPSTTPAPSNPKP